MGRVVSASLADILRDFATDYTAKISRLEQRNGEVVRAVCRIVLVPARSPVPGGPDAGRVRVPKAQEANPPRSGPVEPPAPPEPPVASRPGRLLRPGHPKELARYRCDSLEKR